MRVLDTRVRVLDKQDIMFVSLISGVHMRSCVSMNYFLEYTCSNA